jgi:hypothetical protein
LALRAEVGEAKASASAATSKADAAAEKANAADERACRAERLAQQAVTLAGTRAVMGALVESTPPGRATRTPDGFLSMRGVARRYGLPFEGEGGGLVARVARALALFENPELFHIADVTSGGKPSGLHWLYGRAAVEVLDRPLRAAYAAMIELGFGVTNGGAMIARSTSRSKAWVLQRMFDAAIAAGSPAKDPPPSSPEDGGDQQDLFKKPN